MWLCCPPGRKTLRPVFSRRGSDANWVSYVHKCVRCASFQTKIQFSMLRIFYTVVAKCYKKNMPPINAFCINCNILIKPQSVDAFCTKNFSLMQNASTLPTHFVTKKSKCYNCNIGAKCVVSMRCPSYVKTDGHIELKHLLHSWLNRHLFPAQWKIQYLKADFCYIIKFCSSF